MSKAGREKSDQFLVRLPDGLRAEIRAAALANGRSMNSEIVERLGAGGRTLRDEFAGRAMQAAFAGPGARMVADRDGRYDETNWAEVVASNAYDMADAMLAERAKR